MVLYWTHSSKSIFFFNLLASNSILKVGLHWCRVTILCLAGNPEDASCLLGCLMLSLVNTRTPGSFSAKLLPSLSTDCEWSGFFSYAGVCIFISWALWVSSLLISPSCRGPSEWQYNWLLYQQLLPVFHLLKSCWCCTLTWVSNDDIKQCWHPGSTPVVHH